MNSNRSEKNKIGVQILTKLGPAMHPGGITQHGAA
jgi:hypothetical protein